MVFRLKYLAVPVAALLVLAVAATAALLAWPRAAVQALATHFLERPVRIAELSVSLGDPVIITLRELQIANMPDSSSAEMIAIEAV